jgi:hypothetical protein
VVVFVYFSLLVGLLDFSFFLHNPPVDYNFISYLPLVLNRDTVRTLNKVASKFPPTSSTALVLWNSSNMGSSLGLFLNQIPKYLAYLYQLPKDIKSVLFGIILSDGHFMKDTNLVRLAFNQSYPSHFFYFTHVFILFFAFCNNYPSPIFHANGFLKGFRFRTRSLSCFIPFYEIFYPNGVKVVPSDIDLFTYLDPLALAHMIMGDGASNGCGLILCTDSFTLYDCCRLVNFLHIRYGWKCTITGVKTRHPRVYIPAKYMNEVRKVVGPHILPDFRYKLGIYNYIMKCL